MLLAATVLPKLVEPEVKDDLGAVGIGRGAGSGGGSGEGGRRQRGFPVQCSLETGHIRDGMAVRGIGLTVQGILGCGGEHRQTRHQPRRWRWRRAFGCRRWHQLHSRRICRLP